MPLAAAALLPLAPAQSPAAPAKPASPRVEGLVVDGLGAPIPLADVWVAGNDQTPEARTKPDAQGLFVIGRALAQLGHVTVRATAPGKVEAAEMVAVRDGVATARLPLFDADQLTGVVVDADGKGIADAQVCAAFDLARVALRAVVATTDQDGKFTLAKVPLGMIDVHAVADGCACVTQRVHVGGPGKQPLRIELRPSTGLPLAVEATGLTPEEAVQVQVTLLPYVGGTRRTLPPRLTSGRLDAAGKWQIKGLPEAEYLVSLSAPDLGFAPRNVRLYSEHRGTQVLGPRPKATTDAVARFTAQRNQRVELRGTLRDTEGRPIAGETVVVRARSDGHEVTAQTDERGAFRLDGELGPGTEGVFSLRNSSWFLTSDTDAPAIRRDLLRHQAKLAPQQTYALVARRPAEVVGRLVDADGQPVRWTTVALQETSANRRPEWMEWTRARTGNDGTFRFKVATLPEPVRVYVEGPAGTVASQPLTLAWGQRQDVGELKLAAAGTIEGVVRDGHGGKVAGARVWLREWDVNTGQQRSGSVVETITDRNGRYRFEGVPLGGACLQVALQGEIGIDPAVKPFEVASGEKLEFELTLRN